MRRHGYEALYASRARRCGLGCLGAVLGRLAAWARQRLAAALGWAAAGTQPFGAALEQDARVRSAQLIPRAQAL